MRFSKIADFISSNNKFILTAHETPDGDAIGSECALYAALKQLGKEVIILNADGMAKKYNFMDFDRAVQELNSPDMLPQNIQDWVLIILDTNDIHNIGQVAELVLPYVKEYFIIDHHENGIDILTGNLVESDASSTCEILFDLFMEMCIKLTLPISLAIYTGIVYDTGSFIYPKTTAKTFFIAQKLVESGVSPNDVYAKIYESNSISSLMLQSKVMSTLELFFDNHVSVLTMCKEMIIECGAIYEESDTIINIPLKSEDIKVSVFFKENEEGILRCSMRSKGNINVSEIAQLYGGGGHKTAAGFKSKYPLEEIKSKVLDMFKGIFKSS